jgi:predicted anti-sigma-YlaC factor YlaD
MLTCKQVATLASEYIDHNTDTKLNWKIRAHLLMCSHCRRFIRHLKITNTVTRSVLSETQDRDVDEVLRRIKESAQKKDE